MIYCVLLAKTYHPKGCLVFMLNNFEFITLKDLYERIRTKFSANYTKQTQFFPIFQPKTTIPPKNKPNSNPIQSQSKPILAQKLGGQTQTNPISLRDLPPKRVQFSIIFEYPCLFIFTLYNLAEFKKKTLNFNGDFTKWQMHRKQMQ